MISGGISVKAILWGLFKGAFLTCFPPALSVGIFSLIGAWFVPVKVILVISPFITIFAYAWWNDYCEQQWPCN